MKRREEFLAKALEVHREYEDATAVIQVMLRDGNAAGQEWDAAIARQIHILKVWSELPQQYSDIHEGGVHGGG
jgi:hypothetical protein